MNCYSSSIDRSVAKKLLELAGASSLSMKPPLDLLLDGPALFLGIEGSSHSFVRFKSYTVDYHDNVTELWKPLAGDQTIANCNPLRGEYGVVASSSSR